MKGFRIAWSFIGLVWLTLGVDGHIDPKALYAFSFSTIASTSHRFFGSHALAGSVEGVPYALGLPFLQPPPYNSVSESRTLSIQHTPAKDRDAWKDQEARSQNEMLLRRIRVACEDIEHAVCRAVNQLLYGKDYVEPNSPSLTAEQIPYTPAKDRDAWEDQKARSHNEMLLRSIRVACEDMAHAIDRAENQLLYGQDNVPPGGFDTAYPYLSKFLAIIVPIIGLLFLALCLYMNCPPKTGPGSKLV